MAKNSKRVKKVAKAPVKPRVSGIPRHTVVEAKKVSSPGHRDVTRESVTSYLQPFVAYEARMMGGLPISSSAQPAYGFWTRNVVTTTDIPLTGSTQVGSWVSIKPWLVNQVAVATAMDSLGVPSNWTPYNDPFYSAINTNFESVVCAYQGVRVKNLTPVLGQAGESLIGRFPTVDMLSSYYIHRQAGTAFVKSSADPGVMLTLNHEGTPGQVPQLAGNVVDYSWNLPSASSYDPQSTQMLFASNVGSAQPQSWEIEIVTYYLARPFANTSVFFAPVKHELDMRKFERAVDRSLSRAPELSVARNAMKDDGDSPTILDDLQSIWGGAKAVSRLATAAWSGLRSLFSLEKKRRMMVHLSMLESDADLAELTSYLKSETSLEALRRTTLDSLAPSPFSSSQLEALRRMIADMEYDEVKQETPAPSRQPSLARLAR